MGIDTVLFLLLKNKICSKSNRWLEGSKMKINDITALARPLDLNYPTNRAIALLSKVAIIVSTLVWMVAGQGNK